MWDGHSVPRRALGGDRVGLNRRAERASHIGETQDGQNENDPNIGAHHTPQNASLMAPGVGITTIDNDLDLQ